MKYTLDTNVLLFYVRDKETKRFIEQEFAPFDEQNEAMISVVSIAEIYSLATRNKWGNTKLKVVQKLIDSLVLVEISYGELVDLYVEIETYSNKTNTKRQVTGSAITMGKNDIWIAATAAMTGSKLITSDKNFAHLDGEFFDVIIIERLKK